MEVRGYIYNANTNLLVRIDTSELISMVRFGSRSEPASNHKTNSRRPAGKNAAGLGTWQ